MPHLSQAEMLRYARGRLTSTKRWTDAALAVDDHTGVELFRVGGKWDGRLKEHVPGDCKVHRVTLKESQLEVGRGFAAWIESSRAGAVDPKRPIVLVLGGARGSGKTWFVGLMIVAIALEWPREWQYSVNLSTGQRREVIEAIQEVSDPSWLSDRSDDLRDPWLRFLTDSIVAFTSARNPKRLREAKLRIRAVHINEGQDQPEEVYINAVSSTRNVDGITTIATNRPQNESGDWVSLAANGIEGGEIVGLYYLLDPRKNNAVSRNALDKRAQAIRVVSPEAATADTDPDAPMALAGNMAYPGFRPLPREKGGHIGSPPEVGWLDVTMQESGKAIDSSTGYSFVCGVDFQRRPGIVGAIAKIFKNERGELVLHVLDQIAVRGVEPDFSQALVARGYAPSYGMSGVPILLVGDATGARQNAEHKFSQPTSFMALKADGWTVIPPMHHWRHGTPWNPQVMDSRAQMHALFKQNQILLSPKCKEPCEGFPSLSESFRRAKTGPKGGLVEKGNHQHGPDGVRYLACRFMPRPKPPEVKGGLDMDAWNALRGAKLGWGR